MSEADFFPSADMAEINRIHYELEYTEGISQQMRIPERLKIASSSSEEPPGLPLDASHSTMMHVPERIVIAGDGNDARFGRPRDLDLIQSTPLETVELKTPPRVLTLNDQTLDFLEPEPEPEPAGNSTAQPRDEMRSHFRSRRERCRSENSTMRRNGQINKQDFASPSPSRAPVRACPPLISPEDSSQNLNSATGVLSYIKSTTRRAYQQVLEVLDDSHRSRTALVTFDPSLENTADDAVLTDAASLRRQIIKLNRRLQLLEYENKERAKREMVMYSLTVAFWLVNSWVWLRR
ncbi:mitochondrial fission factor homolog A [Megalobrama amblycephala]|uniref:mitochondrial fission factor homolog A n=1 Tax=Megalobrama amblycephala TaxID=75352 RepID=UPI002013F5AE|nr:mitochondrial fission factor homolog A [Megalobrama amblycephala]XP_048020239.1 mitochondrial fission factor homolog A [Megalobrama amblycephala]XP_048020240.1 mitochondrial fission factor homolog A [Megalobrama amblycephala]